jgi:hypothetical protein
MGQRGIKLKRKRVETVFPAFYLFLSRFSPFLLFSLWLDRQRYPMAQLAPPPVIVKDTGTAKGRGVYSTHAFQTGEVVEESPVIIIQAGFEELPKEMKEIVFNWGLQARPGNPSAVVLGYGSIYNHENPANMRYESDPQKNVIRFIAVRDIAVGEELTINYNAVGGGAEWEDNNWFERMNIEPLK